MRTADELWRLLDEQMSYLRTSMASFDSGNWSEAKRIAVVVRVLCHTAPQRGSARVSRSLLTQLGIAEKLAGMTIGQPVNPNSLVATHNLVTLAIRASADGTFAAGFFPAIGEDEADRATTSSLPVCWHASVMKAMSGTEWSRKQIVEALANRDGCAHVDDLLEHERHLAEQGLGWVMHVGDVEEPLTISPLPPSMRTIAEELHSSINRYCEPDLCWTPSVGMAARGQAGRSIAAMSSGASSRRAGLKARPVIAVIAAFVMVVAAAATIWVLAGSDPATPEATPVGDGVSSVAFLGDSWSCGGGLTGAEAGPDFAFTALAAKTLGWTYLTECEGGTGYTRFYDEATNYEARVDPVLDSNADMVVIQGSTNDYDATEDEVHAAATAVLGSIQEALPEARIVVVGPSYTPEAPSELVDVSRAALEAAAEENGAYWVDIAGWLDTTTDFADGYHPDNEGHGLLAQKLVPVLREVAGQA